MTITNLNEILKQYDLGQINKRSLIAMGAENDNYLIEASTGKYVLRIYNTTHSIRGIRSKADIDYEISFIQHALNADIPTPLIILNNNSEPMTSWKQPDGTIRFAILFPFIDGVKLNKYSAKSIKELARVVDKFFTVEQSFAGYQHDMPYNIIDRAIMTYTGVDEITIPDWIQALWATVQSQTPDILSKQYTVGLVHGDLKLDNLLFDDNDTLLAVLDFDDFRKSYLIEDAVMALLHNLHDPDENILRAGYYQIFIDELQNPILKTELEHLKYFLRTRFIQDIINYHSNDLSDLVETLRQDTEIQRYILS